MMPCICCGRYHDTDEPCTAVLARQDYDWAHGLEVGDSFYLEAAQRRYDLAMMRRADREYSHKLGAA
jgi:hypothetical protein